MQYLGQSVHNFSYNITKAIKLVQGTAKSKFGKSAIIIAREFYVDTQDPLTLQKRLLKQATIYRQTTSVEMFWRFRIPEFMSVVYKYCSDT